MKNVVVQSEREPAELWRRDDGGNLVGVSASWLASAGFNARAAPLSIAGVRETNPDLFRLLAATDSLQEASHLFTAYAATMFGLDRRRAASGDDRNRRYRSSYLRLLGGWAYDANSQEGAVLKGWVESRFGLYPTFHKEPLGRYPSLPWMRYIEEKMGSRFHNNAIFCQLDLLYEYAQWALARFVPHRRRFRLFRGVNSYEENPIVHAMDRRRIIVRLNNLTSFSTDREVAGCFGDWILDAIVPRSKILFIQPLLPGQPLKGEAEVLAIGGDYRVRARYD
jgi:NAD+---dinitrogen-reductase ADP-D-ribosyltransferase